MPYHGTKQNYKYKKEKWGLHRLQATDAPLFLGQS